VKEEKKGKWPGDSILEHYSKLMGEIWEIVSALIGEAIVELVFLSVIRKLEDKHPFLSRLQVSEEGVTLGPAREDGLKMAPVEIHRVFQSLITNLVDVFSALAEGVVSRELLPRVLPKVREAEKLISQK
jgi:hypothetical protein